MIKLVPGDQLHVSYVYGPNNTNHKSCIKRCHDDKDDANLPEAEITAYITEQLAVPGRAD